MATNSKKSMQDLAEVFEDEPVVKVKRMSFDQMDKAKELRLAKKAAKALERAEGAKMAAKFEQPVIAKVVKIKKVPAPKVEPEQVKMVVTTLEDLAKVVRPHEPVVLPVELAGIDTVPEFAALIEAAKFRESAFDADQTYKAKLEVKRDLEKEQRKFSSRYTVLFSEQMTAWLNEPGHEYRTNLNPKEPHVKKLRMWVANVINKAIASKDETAAEYLKIEEKLEETRQWLQIHVADKDEKVFKARRELEKIGVKYEDAFVS